MSENNHSHIHYNHGHESSLKAFIIVLCVTSSVFILEYIGGRIT